MANKMAVIVIEDWMVSDAHLSGLELLAFALIHGCTQKGEGCWYGGYDKLAERIGGKQRGTILVIQQLEQAGAIERFDAVIDGKPKKAIRSLWDSANFADAKNADAENADAKNAELTLQKMQSSSAKNAEPSNSNNIQSKRKVFIKPTIEEIEGFCNENGYQVDSERFFNYYESKGWLVGKSPMKDWKAAVRTWASNQKSSSSSSQPISSPQVAPAPSSREEAMEWAIHPTKDDIKLRYEKLFLLTHPMLEGETKEQYRERVLPEWNKFYKEWIARRVEQVNNKY